MTSRIPLQKHEVDVSGDSIPEIDVEQGSEQGWGVSRPDGY